MNLDPLRDVVGVRQFLLDRGQIKAALFRCRVVALDAMCVEERHRFRTNISDSDNDGHNNKK